MESAASTYTTATFETLHSPRGTQINGCELYTVGLVAPIDDAIDRRLKSRDAEGESHREEGGRELHFGGICCRLRMVKERDVLLERSDWKGVGNSIRSD